MPKLRDALKYAKYANPDDAKRFAQHMVPHVVRPAQIIWNKALGAVFLVLALYFFGYASTHKENPAGMGFGIFLGIVMGFFGITSLLRVRKLNRMQVLQKRK